MTREQALQEAKAFFMTHAQDGPDATDVVHLADFLLATEAAVLEKFKKHHDECGDFRHCECASVFWYEMIGKAWAEDKNADQAEQRRQA